MKTNERINPQQAAVLLLLLGSRQIYGHSHRTSRLWLTLQNTVWSWRAAITRLA